MAKPDSIRSRHEHDFRINGYQTYGKPLARHPDKEHWRKLKDFTLFMSAHRFGIARCAACPRRADLQLHHVHYDTWGRESPADVELLCPRCHDAITNARREERRAYEKAQYQDARKDPAAGHRPPAFASKSPEASGSISFRSPGRPVIDEPSDIQPGQTAPHHPMKPDLGRN